MMVYKIIFKAILREQLRVKPLDRNQLWIFGKKVRVKRNKKIIVILEIQTMQKRSRRA